MYRILNLEKIPKIPNDSTMSNSSHKDTISQFFFSNLDILLFSGLSARLKDYCRTIVGLLTDDWKTQKT